MQKDFIHLYKISTLFLCFIGILGDIVFVQAQTYTEDEIDAIFNEVKLELICATIQFMIDQNTDITNAPSTVDCQNLTSISNTIPKEFRGLQKLFTSFEGKLYKSYGKNKMHARLDKLIYDISIEVGKQKAGKDWGNLTKSFSLSLKELKTETIQRIEKQIQRQETQEENKPGDNTLVLPQQTKTKTQDTMLILLLFILFIGGVGFLYWQNKQLQNQLLDLEDLFQEKYSRLDNRIDTMTPVESYQSLLMKFNFLNEQLNALVQEINVLKSRNQHKMTIEELYAKRTEHLESYEFNPDVQIYYSKIRPKHNAFYPQEFKTEPSRDSIYKVEISLETPDQAVYRVVDRSEYHQIALANPETMLTPACDYANEPYNDSRIITLDTGMLEKKEDKWVILKKAKVFFE